MDDAINITDLSEAELANLLRGQTVAKYRNRKVEYEGETFDSQWELTRWLELKALERAGEIRNLKRQQWVTVQEQFVYHLESGPVIVRAIRLRLDFKYEMPGYGVDSWFIVYDDAKGKMTPEYKLKFKLLMNYFRDCPGVILRLSYK